MALNIFYVFVCNPCIFFHYMCLQIFCIFLSGLWLVQCVLELVFIFLVLFLELNFDEVYLSFIYFTDLLLSQKYYPTQDHKDVLPCIFLKKFMSLVLHMIYDWIWVKISLQGEVWIKICIHGNICWKCYFSPKNCLWALSKIMCGSVGWFTIVLHCSICPFLPQNSLSWWLCLCNKSACQYLRRLLRFWLGLH